MPFHANNILIKWLDIRFAHLTRRMVNNHGQQSTVILLVVRGLNDKCPLLGMQRFVEEMVYSKIDPDIDYDATEWD